MRPTDWDCRTPCYFRLPVPFGGAPLICWRAREQRGRAEIGAWQTAKHTAPAMAAEALVDYYALVGVEHGASHAAIRKAYRAKARDLHPDKNPDDANAAARFDELKKASEVLLDETQRGEFDRKWAAHVAATQRYKAMDDERQRMRSVLEEREAAAEAAAASSTAAAPQAFLDSLRAQSAQFCRQVAGEMQAARQAAASGVGGVASSTAQQQRTGGGSTRVRLRWAPTTGRVVFALSSDDALPSSSAVKRLLTRFGAVAKVAVKGPGVAHVTFEAEAAAAQAAIAAPQGFKITLIKERRLPGAPAAPQRSKRRRVDGNQPILHPLPKLAASAAQLAAVRDRMRLVKEAVRRVEASPT